MSGQPAAGVTLRNDLRELLDEFDFTTDNMLLADTVLPVMPVQETSAHYPVMPREMRLRIPNTERSTEGTYPRDSWEWSDDSYSTKEYGFEEPIDLTRREINSSWIDEEEIASQMATEKLLLAREKRVADAVYNTTTFTGSSGTGAITYEWDKPTQATPFADIEAAYQQVRGKCGLAKSLTTLILTEDLVKFALKTTEIVSSVQYTEAIPQMSAQRKMQFLADYFGIKEILIVNGLFETTKQGNATPGLGQLWSNEYAMLAILNNGGPSWKQRGLGRQPAFSKITDTYLIEEYPEPQKKALIIRAIEFRGTKIFSDYGYLLSNMKTTVSATTNI